MKSPDASDRVEKRSRARARASLDPVGLLSRRYDRRNVNLHPADAARRRRGDVGAPRRTRTVDGDNAREEIGRAGRVRARKARPETGPGGEWVSRPLTRRGEGRSGDRGTVAHSSGIARA